MKKTVAWTVGNPDAYDPYLSEPGRHAKAVGGAVFLRYDEAAKAVENGRLPDVWGLGHLPGAVYVLDLPPDAVGERYTEVPGAHALTKEAPIVGKATP